MKKTFLQMISEIAPAPEALKNVGKQLITKDGNKVIKGKYVTVIDPKTGKEKQIYRTEQGERSVAYKSAIAGYDKRYRKVVEKFQNDPAFKNQVSIIRKNNVFYLNRMYNLIKSQDPSIEALTQLFSKTKNDTEFFSHMNSFIVPLSSVWRISNKIQVGDLWDDENYKKDLENNGFNLILPRNQSPTKFNVAVKWGDDKNSSKASLAEFNQSMSLILNYLQKFVDVEDKIMAEGSIVRKLLDPIPNQPNDQRVFYNTDQILNEIRDEKDFNELFDFLKIIQYKNDSKDQVIGPDRLNFSNAIKNINIEISKLENEFNVLNRDYKKYEDEIDNFKTLSQQSKILQDKLKDNDFIDQIDLLKSIITIPETKIIEAQKTDKPIELSLTTKVFVTRTPMDVYSRRRQAVAIDNRGVSLALPFDVKFEEETITITPDQIELYKFILKTLEDIKKGTSTNINADNLKQMIKSKIDSHFTKEKEKVKRYIESIKTGTVDPRAQENLKKLEELQKTLIELKAKEESRLKEYAIDAQQYLKDLESSNDIKEKMKNIENRKAGISNFINKISIVEGQIKSLESKKIFYNNIDSTSSEIVKILLSNRSIKSFEEVFKSKNILEQITNIHKSLKDIQFAYNGFNAQVKSIIDSSFIVSKFKSKKARNNFIENSKKVFKVIKDFEQFALMLKTLKEKINEAKKIEIKLSDKVMDYEDYDENGRVSIKSLTLSGLINKFSKAEMNDMLNRLVGVIISFKSMLRTIGFIKIYDTAQYHTQLDIAEMDLDTDTEVDDYYVYVGIVPEDVIAQSTFQFWTSCQTLSGPTELNKYVGSGTLLGNIVCFLLALDWSKPTGGNRAKFVKAPIKHSAVTDPDDIMSIKEFKAEAAGGVRGTKKVEIRKFLRSYAIRPVGRVLIKTFELDDMGRGVRTIKPEALMQGGSQEEIETIKFVDRLYTLKSSQGAQAMVTSKGVARGDTFDRYSTIFYKGIQSLAKRLNINVKVGNYKLREDIYNDGTSEKVFSSAIKKYESGQKILFARETTSELLELLKQDKNFLRYRTFRHALFSKDVVDGTLDLQGSEIESLDPMHPTNLPKYGRGLSNDKFEDFDAIEWMVNDNFRKNSGNFEEPLTKEEMSMYSAPIKEAKIDYEDFKKKNPDLEL